MNPAVLAWALIQPVGSRGRGLVDAYTAGTTRVVFDGRTVEYRSLAEIGTALAALYAAQIDTTARRPNVTYASFSRGGGT